MYFANNNISKRFRRTSDYGLASGATAQGNPSSQGNPFGYPQQPFSLPGTGATGTFRFQTPSTSTERDLSPSGFKPELATMEQLGEMNALFTNLKGQEKNLLTFKEEAQRLRTALQHSNSGLVKISSYIENGERDHSVTISKLNFIKSQYNDISNQAMIEDDQLQSWKFKEQADKLQNANLAAQYEMAKANYFLLHESPQVEPESCFLGLDSGQTPDAAAAFWKLATRVDCLGLSAKEATAKMHGLRRAGWETTDHFQDLFNDASPLGYTHARWIQLHGATPVIRLANDSRRPMELQHRLADYLHRGLLTEEEG